jgi:hypothetical protein
MKGKQVQNYSKIEKKIFHMKVFLISVKNGKMKPDRLLKSKE